MINIKVLKDCAEVSYQLPNSTKRQTKIIGISDIPGLFDTKMLYDSGGLPLFGKENAYGIQRIVQKDNHTIVFVQCINPFVNVLHTSTFDLSSNEMDDMGIAHLDHIDRTEIIEKRGENFCYKNIHLPNLLMCLGLKKDKDKVKLTHSGLLAYEDMFITDKTQMYCFPLSNTYKESPYGQICWGDHHASADSLTQSVGVIHTFLGGVMNTHLYEDVRAGDYTCDASYDLLAYLSYRSHELSSFPYKDVKMQPIIKYGELLNYINQNWKI